MFVFQNAYCNVTCAVSFDAVPLDRVHTKPYGQKNADFFGWFDVHDLTGRR